MSRIWNRLVYTLSCTLILSSFFCASFFTTTSQAAAPQAAIPQARIHSHYLLPETTKGYISIPDLDKLIKSWNASQFGQLLNDPKMKPFTEDLKQQINRKLSAAKIRLGLTFQDLEGVPTGEVSLSILLNQQKHSIMVMTIDAKGNKKQLKELLDKVDADMAERKAKKTTLNLHKTNVTVYTLPIKKDEKKADQTFYFVKDGMLVACDDQLTMNGILSSFNNPLGNKKNLFHVEAYQATLKRVVKATGKNVPHARWFVEPFGFIEALREKDPPKHKDLVSILRRQGFNAIQGAGGSMFFATAPYEMLHYTSIYAPTDKAAKGGQKYRLGARILNFPNGGLQKTLPWIPSEIACHTTFNIDIPNAFKYIDTIVDEIAGQKGFFKEILEGLENDPYGANLNVKKDVIDHLQNRVTVISDYKLPIDPKSERIMTIIACKNPAKVMKTLDKVLKNNRQAIKIKINGFPVWKISPEVEDEDEDDIPGIVIPGVGGGNLIPPPAAKALPDAEKAITVVHGHLVLTNDLSFMKKVLTKPNQKKNISQSVDYQLVIGHLRQLGAREACVKIFSRMDEEFRPTYELIKAGKMPQSETLLGKALNRLFDEDKGKTEAPRRRERIKIGRKPKAKKKPREQKIDGSKLPDFNLVRRYLGPAGTYVISEDNGWFITSVALSKQQQVAKLPAKPGKQQNIDKK